MSVGLDLVFVRLFRFTILCVLIWFSLDCLVPALFALAVFGLVSSVQGYAKRLAVKNVSEMTCFVSRGTSNLN